MAAPLGVGVDICLVRRVAAAHARFGRRFLERAFHPTEVERFERLLAQAGGVGGGTLGGGGGGGMPAAAANFLASRWAAKEALHKALRSHRLLFPEVEVCTLPSGGGPAAAPSPGSGAPTAAAGAAAAVAAAAGADALAGDWRGTGGRPFRTAWSGGPPGFRFHGAAAAVVAGLGLPSPPQLSLSHDGEYAVAFVVVPPPLR